MLRGEPKALSTQLVVVGQIGPPFAGASSGDVVRKQPREPEAVVAEMRAQQEGPFPGVVEPHEVLHHVDQIVVSLVVAAADADVPVVIAELEQQGGQVVGQRSVVDPGGAQRVAHRHVGEQRRRRDHERAQGQEGGEQAGLVEQLVGSLLEELPLVTRAARSVTVRQGERDEQEVLRTQATTDVGQNHAQTSL